MKNKRNLRISIISLSLAITIMLVGCGRNKSVETTPAPVATDAPVLTDAPDVFITRRSTPLCDIPQLQTGCQRIDNDNYIFTEEEYLEFIKNRKMVRTEWV